MKTEISYQWHQYLKSGTRFVVIAGHFLLQLYQIYRFTISRVVRSQNNNKGLHTWKIFSRSSSTLVKNNYRNSFEDVLKVPNNIDLSKISVLRYRKHLSSHFCKGCSIKASAC